jgi:hypothetical protein
LIHRLAIAAACACMLADAADAPSLSFSGFLNDQGNATLRGSGPAPSPALFADDWNIANNFAVYGFNLPVAGQVSFGSLGFAAGGAGPYLTSLFLVPRRANAGRGL